MIKFEIYKPFEIEEVNKNLPKLNDSRWRKLTLLIDALLNQEPVDQESSKIDVKIDQYINSSSDLVIPEPLWYDPEINSASTYLNARNFYNNKNADNNANLAYDYLINKWKFTPTIASGIIGNLYHENLANPALTVNDSRGTTSFGIACFNSKGLLNDYLGYVTEKNLDKNDLYSQLDYIAEYIIQGKDKNLTREMKRPDLTPEHASFVFGKYFEKFAGKDGTGKGYLNYEDDEHIRRRNTALQIYKLYNQ